MKLDLKAKFFVGMLRKVGRCHKRLTNPSHDMSKEYLHLANKECEFLRNVHQCGLSKMRDLSSFHTSLNIHSGKCSALIFRHSPSYTEQNEKEKRMIWRNLKTETGNLGILLIISNMMYEPKVQTFEVQKFKISLLVM